MAGEAAAHGPQGSQFPSVFLMAAQTFLINYKLKHLAVSFLFFFNALRVSVSAISCKRTQAERRRDAMMGSESAKPSAQLFSLGGHAASQAAAKDNELKINR